MSPSPFIASFAPTFFHLSLQIETILPINKRLLSLQFAWTLFTFLLFSLYKLLHFPKLAYICSCKKSGTRFVIIYFHETLLWMNLCEEDTKIHDSRF